MKTSLLAILILAAAINTTFAHCDSVEGPVVKAAQKALETGNINHVLIWVQPENEDEIRTMFSRVNEVRSLSEAAKQLSDNYFYETVVRVHRAGEGAAYDGLKPADYQIPEGIALADAAVETGDIHPAISKLKQGKEAHVKELFAQLKEKSNFGTDDLKAGREFVAAYVTFIHYVEANQLDAAPAPDNHNTHNGHHNH